MALVSYSDSEASDSEPENVTQPSDKKITPVPGPPAANPPKPTTTPGGANFQSIVDRSNPRKIRVALPEIKPETSTDGDQGDQGEDGPARKKAKIGGGGGAFSGFNSFLPAPKRNNATADQAKKPSGPARKVFNLKTGAGPGFDRDADAEMRQDQAFAEVDNETIPKAGSLQKEPAGTGSVMEKKDGETKLKGNPMMFKPLSVGRPQKKKQPPKTTPPVPTPVESKEPSQPPKEHVAAQPAAPPAPAPPAPKPKISLFSLAKEEEPSTTDASTQGTTYEPLVYSTPAEAPPAGPQPDPEAASIPSQQTAGSSQTLGNIADDLNLSRAERRHLFGRNADSQSQVLHFNTDAEYVSNQQAARQTDLAAAQHNPVRAIAPGKHTLQQLVNAASTQKDALEESFATGRRNKKEAGSKYGW
ncbi:hypothetical protein ASPWEDRAFT_44446 [Aspergillus wentii DTO 134E9]|uniref:Mitotic checkpoint regulator, MAD2B-interacting-domain-containing protein n=1 Tax=Aspergillus wentii DTO 134E9 TaxID=1073089 RepID=A0A1L9RBQ1_ASPWE|nr:uncharacterized protein ASPWEDRAFT_44446 [Aspergillus wentii DTO 134E9]KAI9934909.1 hypothetical protein MW887_000530 [Aspergillus wentii]OJJ32349.1 hypothetical protein ASPWEDRAFT_44446 [Aspergillus wentii DTO 134E9]